MGSIGSSRWSRLRRHRAKFAFGPVIAADVPTVFNAMTTGGSHPLLLGLTEQIPWQPGTTGPFIRKYIFPGAYVPALSETFAATERCGLWCDDMEVLRLHYYYTVKHWRERFAKNRARAATIYDERFCRMWEFYLAAVELEFLHGSHMVFQILLSTKRDAVPITRNSMIDFERAGWARAQTAG